MTGRGRRWAQAVRPHVLGHDPVPQTGGVVATGAEPTVIYHEPLDTYLRGDFGQVRQPFKGHVKSDGFPGVEHDRPRTGRVPGPPPQHGVQPGRGPVHPIGGVDRINPRGRHRLAGAEADLAGGQDLPRPQQGGPGIEPLHQVALVPGPAEMDAPNLPGARPEPLAAGEQHQGRVRAGTAAPLLAQPDALVEIMALQLRLVAPAPGEVGHLDGVLGDG